VKSKILRKRERVKGREKEIGRGEKEGGGTERRKKKERGSMEREKILERLEKGRERERERRSKLVRDRMTNSWRDE
jgi:hypothetical protein